MLLNPQAPMQLECARSGAPANLSASLARGGQQQQERSQGLPTKACGRPAQIRWGEITTERKQSASYTASSHRSDVPVPTQFSDEHRLHSFTPHRVDEAISRAPAQHLDTAVMLKTGCKSRLSRCMRLT